MKRCPLCKTTQTIFITGRDKVCYNCGIPLEEVEEPVEIVSLGEDLGGETVGEELTADDNDYSHLDD
jgi:hypothetical protein